jgi:pyrimidine-nucleoside phosphorylase
MRMYDIIAKKRDGKELSYDEISFFINGYCKGDIPDYQASALLMAIFIKKMNERETSNLTMLMSQSGDKIDLSGIDGVKVDKHSTGGVGDKTTLILAPVVAACGVPVAKMSGRGLGHTGGTIDKLESIPGFNTTLTLEEFTSNIKRIGLAIAGQTGNLAPADKKLYSLRDVTATVNNISLIASSIMSKKLASGADSIVLDVKTGSGAFMQTLDNSIDLAKTMVRIGELVGKKTVAIVTDMDIPLGKAIGNSLEVIEAIDTLKGNGPEDLGIVSFELAARMLELSGISSIDECRNRVMEVVESGEALNKLREMIELQGGDTKVIDNYSLFGSSSYEVDFIAEKAGYIKSLKTNLLGEAAVLLGAGREIKESKIDHSAGLILHKKTGMKVRKGEIIARLFTNKQDKIEETLSVLTNSVTYSDEPTTKRPLILAYIDSKSILKNF